MKKKFNLPHWVNELFTKNLVGAIVLFCSLGLGIFIAVIALTTATKQFVWKADTGLEKRVERLLFGPQKIKSDNQIIDIVQVFQIHPLFLKDKFDLKSDQDYYKTFEELNIKVSEIQELIYMVYDEAGRDPTQLLGGGGDSCSGEDH